MRNKRGENQKIAGQINRLAVFRFVKTVMESDGICPPGHEVAKVVGITAQAANAHMKALAHADGLPFPIPDGALRKVEGTTEVTLEPESKALALFNRSGYFDQHGPTPVDLLFRD